MLHEKWKIISLKIDGIKTSSEFLINALKCKTDYGIGLQKHIIKQIKETIDDISEFKKLMNNNTDYNSIEAIISLEEFCQERGLYHNDSAMTDDMQIVLMVSLLTRMLLMQNEVSYYLEDHQRKIKNISEKAFLHLQRKIIADPDENKKWKAAIEREIECEKLGSLHLLWHGIWAFKVNADGERTDLIFNDEVLNIKDSDLGAVSGLVLTEWKVLRSGENATSKFSEARNQARMYTKGSLAGVELAKYRYAIVVSEENIHTPDDILDNNIIWRHINIAINSKSPSERSRRPPQINGI